MKTLWRGWGVWGVWAARILSVASQKIFFSIHFSEEKTSQRLTDNLSILSSLMLSRDVDKV
ncbi:MAG: hypothetical protein F6K40_30770 [Okeania sp. SIO3I5]|uniref:hypothetical protein n=1 Tax=Okeania sp. SIO3I5 TaxID=2607805 RepID=UPI0013BA7CDB|nr:hypothetical protein [Okeania sp. SIO3I5]NEQ40380.1 hypothetical protein [Okeania sp. SIO3I5]